MRALRLSALKAVLQFLSGYGPLVSLGAMVVRIVNAHRSARIQARILAIQEAVNARTATPASVWARVRIRSDRYIVTVGNDGPAVARKVELSVGDESPTLNGASIPPLASRRFLTVRAVGDAEQRLREGYVTWQHPSGQLGHASLEFAT